MKLSKNEMKEAIKQQCKIEDIAEEFGYKILGKKSGKYLNIDVHGSLVIFTDTNSYYHYATGKGGDVFDFMKNMENIKMDYPKAFAYLSKKVDPSIEIKEIKKEERINKYAGFPTVEERKKRASMLLNSINETKDNGNKNVIAYLVQERGIDPTIVFDFLNKGLLHQEISNGYRACVFVGYDDKGLPACACRRACSSKSKFKGEFEGNDYRYGWLYDPAVEPRTAYLREIPKQQDKTLICFESEIEKMSYLTLMKLQGEDINQYAYLSTGSAAKYKTILSVAENFNYKSVIVAFNNDWESALKPNGVNAGQRYAQLCIDELKEKEIEAISIVPENNINDWNDRLIDYKKGLPNMDKSVQSYKKKAVGKYQKIDKRKVETKTHIISK